MLYESAPSHRNPSETHLGHPPTFTRFLPRPSGSRRYTPTLSRFTRLGTFMFVLQLCLTSRYVTFFPVLFYLEKRDAMSGL